jgi:molybdate transport system substrate-binding protein
MADTSLGIAVTRIARNYSRYKNIVVNTSFASQYAQQEQINEGAAIDIIITSKTAWIDELKRQGLVDIYSKTLLAGDRLALVGAVNANVASAEPGRFPALAIIKASGGDPVFLLGNPQFLIEGAYAKEALRNLGVAEDLEPYTLYVKRLDQMFNMVVNQQAFGICFYSSTTRRTDMKVIDVLPESSYKKIHYYAVAIASDNMDEARKFMEYLKTSEVKDIFKEEGFVVDPAAKK